MSSIALLLRSLTGAESRLGGLSSPQLFKAVLSLLDKALTLHAAFAKSALGHRLFPGKTGAANLLLGSRRRLANTHPLNTLLLHQLRPPSPARGPPPDPPQNHP